MVPWRIHSETVCCPYSFPQRAFAETRRDRNKNRPAAGQSGYCINDPYGVATRSRKVSQLDDLGETARGGAAQGAANPGNTPMRMQDLAMLVHAWSGLPCSVRDQIMALVHGDLDV